MDGKWEVRGVEPAWENDWLKVEVADVEVSDGSHLSHAVVTSPKHPAGFAMTLANVPGKGVLMLWRHRFITDDWTWELPGGGIDGRELPKKAAEREFLEETGWKAGALQPLVEFQPANGIMDHKAHTFITHEATWQQEGRDRNEAADIAWLSVDEIKALMKKGDVSDGPTLVALLHAFTFDLLR